MRVHVDEARQQCRGAEIDHARAGRDREAAADLRDVVALDQHDHVVDALAGDDVDHVRGAHRDARRGSRRMFRRHTGGNARQAQQQERESWFHGVDDTARAAHVRGTRQQRRVGRHLVPER